MGRDIAGLRFDKKPSVVNVKSNDMTSNDVAHVSPKTLAEEDETKNSEPDDHEEDMLELNSSSMSSKAQQFHNEESYDDDCSSGSSTSTSGQSNKFKVTVPVAPKFICEERLERRKEYYAKLEEKHKALEREKLEREARIKEEEQAAVKQLRKSMVYKANPIPSFYREGPPPKAELKKIPVTRAKSPKLTRRRSCGDAGKSTSEDESRRGEQETRRSVGVHRECKNSNVTSKGKNLITSKKSNENTKGVNKDDQVEEDHQENQKDEDGVES